MRVEGNVTAIAEVYQLASESRLDSNLPTMELLYRGSVLVIESHQFFVLDVGEFAFLKCRSIPSERNLCTLLRERGIA